MKIFYLTLILLFSILLSSCKKAEAPIPSYIAVNSFTFSTDTTVKGTNKQNFTDVWVYIDDQLRGCYKLPAVVPIQASGSHKIKLSPGIRVDGSSDIRATYSPVKPYTVTLNLIEKDTVLIHPVVDYYPGLLMTWQENFENAGLSLIRDVNCDTTIKKTSIPSQIFEGQGSGVFSLTSSKPTGIAKTSIKYKLPIPLGGGHVYLEMHYRCNQTFNVGLLGDVGDYRSVITLKPTDGDWKKIYILLDENLGRSLDDFFYVYFSGVKDASVSNTEILVDNIKLIN